jgi:hypothetical protein
MTMHDDDGDGDDDDDGSIDDDVGSTRHDKHCMTCKGALV